MPASTIHPEARTPWIARGMLVLCALGFLLQQNVPERSWLPFALWPEPLFRWWQLITYGFLHSGMIHLVFNAIGIITFGFLLERVLGWLRFSVLYLVGLVSAALAQLIAAQLAGDLYPTIGASGAVLALLFAYAFLYPRARILLLIPPIPMPAWLFATLFAALSVWLASSGKVDSVAHFAHLGGMFGGVLMMPMLWRYRAASQSKAA